MTEICVEVKDSIENAVKRLSDLGYIISDRYTICDNYFTKLDKHSIEQSSYQDLLNNSIIVRLVKSKNGEDKKIMYKSKTIVDGKVIDEKKYSVKVDDTMKAVQVLSAGGLECWCDYKYENIEFFDGEKYVVLQDVEGLGLFMEIEDYQNINNLSAEEKYIFLSNLAKSFGLNLGDDCSCKKVYMKYLASIKHSEKD